ncbi:glycoside hydrolase family 55 protein [Patellaria atrata CBS 101060]|uniref:Glycoside hydrolase family 55 protein n=1 Tax=Patellaria atrata CBS 101060 TaxID=1346257 RepID=A0A9P4SK97_9PEZI|nr:glycoside hydrolase family 55 protein [Patellaria atrata CBS 101060]
MRLERMTGWKSQPPRRMGSGGGFWQATIARKGSIPYRNAGDYKVFRNVKDFGAVGDGNADDTVAINNAITAGNRCGRGCDSSTTTPAIVYFPPGTYKVSRPIIQYYYSQFIGDASNLPVIKASPDFQGMAVIDSDPYIDGGNGAQWYTNQNNFFRQIRNFVIDLTAQPMSTGTGIHWQVAQATSLQNIRFEMIKGGGSANKQQGIFMENGSGGFMTDLTFNGGNYGAFLGSQQFTTRNLKFNDCNTAIFMNWNWLWTFKSVEVNRCGVGIDMSNGGSDQTVGSVLVLDSKISATQAGIRTSWSGSSAPVGGGALILDNVDFSGSSKAVADTNGGQVLAGGSVVRAWAQGRTYVGGSGQRTRGDINPAPVKPAGLLDSSGKIFERAKPQYENVPASAFVSIKSKGARGDGVTDDTAAIQAAMDSISPDQILYFDHGAYIITRTVRVPRNIRIVGEIWPLIMASGSFFGNQDDLKPVWQVGQPGETGSVEISDLIFETAGPAPGAVLMEWNVAGDAGRTGLWDVHFRVGGSAGTKLQSDTCAKQPGTSHGPNSACVGAGLLFRVTKSASVYVENCWFWVADHELDRTDFGQIDIYNGRGVLIESTKPVWLYGTASEHNVLYNYQFNNARNVFLGAIQTETPYYQGNPDATTPYRSQSALLDPNFATASGNRAKKAWGVRVIDSSDILIYGAGLYSFFENYGQDCVESNDCQLHMVSIEGNSDVRFFGLSTKASVNMVTVNGQGIIRDSDNRSNFAGTLALWRK